MAADGQGKGGMGDEVMEVNGVGGGGGQLSAKVKASPTVRGKWQKGKRQQAQNTSTTRSPTSQSSRDYPRPTSSAVTNSCSDSGIHRTCQ